MSIPPNSYLAALSDPTLIHQVAETTSQRDRDALDQSVVQLIFQFLDARTITLYRVVQDGQSLRISRRLFMDRERGVVTDDASDETVAAQVFAETPVWEQCITHDEVTHLTLPDGVCRTLFPVCGSREVAGLLEIDTAKPMDSRDSHMVRGILRILRNQLSLLDYGERDELTGLLNRRTFEGRFEKLVSARPVSRTKDAPHRRWLGILDIDHFKSINDNYGHLFGDEVLLLVSRIMVDTLRDSDRLFRFGGEEFLIMVDGPSRDCAYKTFERIRTAIDTYTFPQIGRVTVSMGYTEIRQHDAPTTCMERADAALYYAKGNGRNNTREYEALLESGHLSSKQTDDNTEFF